MISFIRFIFPPKNITIGSLWVSENDYGNPFEYKVKYKVLDTQNGFVKYEVIGSSGMQYENSDSIRNFYAFNRKIKETK